MQESADDVGTVGSRLVKTGSFVVKITDVCVGPRDDVDIVELLLLVIIKPEAQNENQLLAACAAVQQRETL